MFKNDKKLGYIIKDNHDKNLRTCVYILQKGLMEKRESQTQTLQEAFQIKIQNYEDGICPFEITKEKESRFLQSKIFKNKNNIL